jgi:hypothetical protein
MIYFRPINRELPSTKFQPENNIFFHDFFFFLLFFCNAFSTMIFFFFFTFLFVYQTYVSSLSRHLRCFSSVFLFVSDPQSPHLLLCISCLFVLLFVVTQCQVVFVPKGKVFSILARLFNRVQAAKLRKNKTLKLLFNRKVLLRKLLEAF